MTDEILAAVRYQLEQDHPVMAAMAARVTGAERRVTLIAENIPSLEERQALSEALPPPWFDVAIVFDGPALPSKHHFEFRASHANFKGEIWAALRECEVQIAAAMKKSGLGA